MHCRTTEVMDADHLQFKFFTASSVGAAGSLDSIGLSMLLEEVQKNTKMLVKCHRVITGTISAGTNQSLITTPVFLQILVKSFQDTVLPLRITEDRVASNIWRLDNIKSAAIIRKH